MWPFTKKKQPVTPTGNPQQILFSQLDTTPQFGDNTSLTVNDWIRTTALNTLVEKPETMGLPPAGTGEEATYNVADRLSRLRELMNIPK